MTSDHQHWWARPDPAGLADGCAGTAVPEQVSAFHRSMPDYSVTPLVELPAVAQSAGIGKVLVKDESQRLGLPAFKMLGASWAIARLVARKARVPAPSTFAELKQLAAGSPLQLLAATAGNHGRAVARVAGLLGVEAKVWIPSTSPAELADAISSEGAEVTVIDDDYDEALLPGIVWKATFRTPQVRKVAFQTSRRAPGRLTGPPSSRRRPARARSRGRPPRRGTLR